MIIAWSMSAGWTLPQAGFRNTFWIVFVILELSLFLSCTMRASVKAARQPDPNWAESQSVSFDAMAIRTVSPSATIEIAWNAVEEATETGGGMRVRFRPKKVFYIPSHAMQEPGVRDAVRSMLQTKLGERGRLSA